MRNTLINVIIAFITISIVPINYTGLNHFPYVVTILIGLAGIVVFRAIASLIKGKE